MGRRTSHPGGPCTGERFGQAVSASTNPYQRREGAPHSSSAQLSDFPMNNQSNGLAALRPARGGAGRHRRGRRPVSGAGRHTPCVSGESCRVAGLIWDSAHRDEGLRNGTVRRPGSCIDLHGTSFPRSRGVSRSVGGGGPEPRYTAEGSRARRARDRR